MFKVIDLNDTGKTKKLLTECSAKNGVIICAHPERVLEKCITYGITPVNAYGYEQARAFMKFTENREVLNSEDVYVDELERFISTIIPNLKGYSLTIDK